MSDDVLSRIRETEAAATGRVAAARQNARDRRQQTERDAAVLLAQTETEAKAEAQALYRQLTTEATAEAHTLRQQGVAQAEALRQQLTTRTEDAAAQIVAFILPVDRETGRPGHQETGKPE